VDRVLAAVPPVAPPIGFRDAVLRRIRAERRSPYEWPMALVLDVTASWCGTNQLCATTSAARWAR